MPVTRPATPNDPVRAWTKMTSEMPPMPNGRRATTEATEMAPTWGAETTRAHGPRPPSGFVASECILGLRPRHPAVRDPVCSDARSRLTSAPDERLPPPFPLRRRDDGALRGHDLGGVRPRAGGARLLDPLRSRPLRRGPRADHRDGRRGGRDHRAD